jgi:phosphopantothenoylcysteine decarboxylase/phosphopantothenate--cysteine ligase
MMNLSGKKLLLAVTGSIAAYKTAFLTRLLVRAGAEVKVIMSPSAKDFITPLTLSTLSKNPVYSDVSSGEGWNNHVELGLWADAMIVAPATANTLAKMAHGQCDNMVLAAYLSARCPVFVAPAMDLDVWAHPSTVRNIALLESYGNFLIPVEAGELASGLVGKGRMAEPENILSFVYGKLNPSPQDMAGKTVLITSGPSVEAIDPVRFISNHSSGKMGCAIAEQMAERGAKVFFVCGPSQVYPTHTNIQLLKVQSAQEMFEMAAQHFDQADVILLAAAVADYTPIEVATLKIKKKSATFSIDMKKTVDIAATLGQQKQKHQIMVGFALETNNPIEHALRKLQSKNLDFIVLNSLADPGAGFGHDTNKVTFIDAAGTQTAFDLQSKKQVAQDICAKVCSLFS